MSTYRLIGIEDGIVRLNSKMDALIRQFILLRSQVYGDQQNDDESRILIMGTLADLNTKVSDIKDVEDAGAVALNGLVDEVRSLKDIIANGGAVTEADIDAVINALNDNVQPLAAAIANVPEEPTPDPTPTARKAKG